MEVRDGNIFKLSFAPWVRENRIWGDMRDEENIEKLNVHKRNLHTLSNTEPIVGKKWEPRNPVPGPFSAKIRKVNQNSESRLEFGK